MLNGAFNFSNWLQKSVLYQRSLLSRMTSCDQSNSKLPTHASMHDIPSAMNSINLFTRHQFQKFYHFNDRYVTACEDQMGSYCANHAERSTSWYVKNASIYLQLIRGQTFSK